MEKLLNEVCSTTNSYESFEKLYTKYYQSALIFLVSIIKNREEAENMVQDVFLKIWMKREKLVLDSSLQAYVFTSLRNIAFDYLKKCAKDEKLKTMFLDDMKSFEENEAYATESVAKVVDKAINKLTEKRKMIIKLNIEDGKSYQEIAQIMQISKNTVKNQLIKAKQHLRNYIEYPILTS